MRDLRRRGNPYSSELLRLRDAINAPFSAIDYLPLLFEYSEEVAELGMGTEDEPVEFYQKLPDEEKTLFERWLRRGGMYRMCDDFPEECPLNLYFRNAKVLPPSTWLIHFSPAADSVARRGFVYGQPTESYEYWRLPLTKHQRAPSSPGWNFAFLSDSSAAYSVATEGENTYGVHAVMFQSPCVFAYHAADENEQAIFLGQDVQNIVYIENADGVLGVNSKWTVSTRKTQRVLVTGDFERVQQWVRANASQYGKHLWKS